MVLFNETVVTNGGMSQNNCSNTIRIGFAAGSIDITQAATARTTPNTYAARHIAVFVVSDDLILWAVVCALKNADTSFVMVITSGV